jgi:thymidylate synthase
LSLKVNEDEMPSENQIDLAIALRKIHELSLLDGDLGYAYWYEVGQLLRRAGAMQAQIGLLSKELERCHARRRQNSGEWGTEIELKLSLPPGTDPAVVSSLQQGIENLLTAVRGPRPTWTWR